MQKAIIRFMLLFLSSSSEGQQNIVPVSGNRVGGESFAQSQAAAGTPSHSESKSDR